jgi:hypothetical protein
MRVLGDKYVKHEFRSHKDSKPEFVVQFFEEWDMYLNMLRKNTVFGDVGKDMDSQEIEKMSQDQRLKLLELKEETTKLPGLG